MTTHPRLRVDIHVELICPWCQIGKRHFERARALLKAEHPELAVEVHWHLQTLLPDLPEEGLPFQAFYEHRLGSAAAVAVRQSQVKAAGRAAGLDFAFERIERMPHTGLAHALLADAREQLEPEGFELLLERLFAAHFQQGESLSDPLLLAALADGFGVVPAAVARPAVSPLQTPGVPYFVFNRSYAISGARPASDLLAVMGQAVQPGLLRG
ncbi:DsbA family oxidoreductase [Pelomonas sp. SE-A7]|uniref:DsbA family oxidoreductase n=1 Tax=Pelomonas sp. SE-A7 TaxID=3054953 RepID=UPI00259CE775|nr:DsbA family oxidoreductase [Pelomonas sp. SE-A7]MDM4764456.1 DsbA family oxidoreductase [Pelomonas sp. SE-A7]